MNAYLIAATALIAGVGPCALACLRSDPVDGLVALELAGALTTLALLCLAEGFHRGTYFGVALVCAVLTWIGGIVIARFLSRNP
jgi:multisubunit Na+/H+ antiporter MnhF subunit